MYKRSLYAIVMILAMLFSLCACNSGSSSRSTDPSTEPPTPEPPVLTAAQIAEKMQKALEEAPCSQLEMVMDMAITFDAGGGEKMDMTTKTTTQTTMSLDPVSSRTVTSANISVAGETTVAMTENYIVVENGELVSYINAYGTWTRVPMGLAPEEFTSSNNAVSIDPDNVVLDDTVTEWNGTPVICLKTQLTGDLVQSAVSGLLRGTDENSGVPGESAGILDTVDYSKLSCDAVIYLDTETYLPVAEEMTFYGMNEVMAPIYDGLGLTLDVTRCISVVSFLSYEAQPEITLPQGVN